MKEKENSYLLKQYIRQYYPIPLLLVVFSCVFACVFSMYDLEAEAVLYAAALCFLILLPTAAIHFSHFVKRHQERMRLEKELTLSLANMPEPKNIADKDYQELLTILKNELDRTITEWEKEKQEHMDYYTTWVHQIKTPISVIRMLLQENDTRENRGIQDEVFRIEQYVEMVLSYLRLGSESSDYVIEKCSLDGIIRQAIRKYASQFVRKRIRMQYEGTDCEVLTDEKWLLFIVEQLLSNAVKYTYTGSVTISVTDRILKIEDTGIGIAPEDLPRIFEKGFTGYNGRADKKSTGLGLYLCRMAAGRLSHRIWAESVPGQGTAFYLDLLEKKLEVE